MFFSTDLREAQTQYHALLATSAGKEDDKVLMKIKADNSLLQHKVII